MVELMAVIAIIAILAAVVTGGVVIATKKAAVHATKGLIERLDLAVGNYYEDYGAYPPDRIPSSGWGGLYGNPGVNLNTPPETLWYFLAGMYENEDIDKPDPVGFREKLARKDAYISFQERDLKRTGRVFWMSSNFSETSDAHSPDDDFPEIVDAWGTPIQYVRIDSYAGPSVVPRGNPDTYDVVSRGPDRKVITPNYHRRDEEQDGVRANRDNIGNFTLQ